MNKAQKKSLFQAIEKGKINAIDAILATEPDALEAFGEHNNYVRDKTPLMYALQCANFELAHQRPATNLAARIDRRTPS